MARANPLQFIQQVRSEAAKVVWPTRRETVVTTIMVFVMAALAAAFFFGVDTLIGFGIDQILHLGATSL
ncbi:preprotein translocase subunit SecE [Albimonas sp. CAU 1670]|uniref:preprotein translocase subunit SecE n=1 Tax=Albimonas sp. CAU 1670 TaxID=3032599 RepID=UPI0023DC1BD0|nr:preprotein translocase subunit SecE [Albimonas sp. CAU 1670]MDF2234319.1 preprotein translocase subunit SecE [Albimonas sp. CAU 1670]